MKFAFDTPALSGPILAATTADELAAPLAAVVQSGRLVVQPDAMGHSLFTEDLDAAVPHVARLLNLRDRPAAKGNARIVVVASQIYAIGGHTRVIGDITRGFDPAQVTLILTDLYGNTPYRRAPGSDLSGVGIAAGTFLLLKSPEVLDRTAELYCLLAAIRPTRIFLVNHHMDLCAVAGCYPFRDVTEFVHHADHLPSIGASLPWSAHADLTYNCHLKCREAGVEAVYASMAPPAAPAVAAPVQPKGGGLVFATCGHPSKYAGLAPRQWAAWVVECLREPGSRFLHIGPHNEGLVGQVTKALEAAGIDPARYEFLGARASLADDLIKRGVDVYVGSYPSGGGRANLEAMMARVPVIYPTRPDAAPLMFFANPLPGWLEVKDPADMPAAIARARAMKAEMAGAAFGAALDEELSRFAAYVAGAPLPEPAAG